MAISTRIVGPYDFIPTYDKTRVMCGIPSVIVKELFTDTFTLRGVQDKILARIFHIFYLELNSQQHINDLASCITMQDKETVLNNVLIKLGKLQKIYESTTLAELDALLATADELSGSPVSPSYRHGPDQAESNGPAKLP